MIKKPVIISSSGLKNVVFNKDIDEDFVFAFGEEKIRMKNIFADFISPKVSRLHQTDPTIQTINFCETITTNKNDFEKLTKSFLTSDIITFLQQISSGYSIEINEDQAIRLRILSIILGNEELHAILNELFPPKYSLENMNIYLDNIENYFYFSQSSDNIDFASLISFISHHFYAIDHEIFLKLPRRIQYMILTHPKLQIDNEDSLYNIISRIIYEDDEEEKSDEFSDIMFLELIELSALSEEKFIEFINNFDINGINGQLWSNLCQRFNKSLHNNAHKNIFIGGYNGFNQLGGKPNNYDKEGHPVIHPSMKLTYNPSINKSYTIYNGHAVIITNTGQMKGIGFNGDGRISPTLPMTGIDKFTQFTFRSEKKLDPISAVCLGSATLYMVSIKGEEMKKLILCDGEINYGRPIVLNIGNHQPVALFGGCYLSAVIGSEGEIIFINQYSLKISSNSLLPSSSLPDGEKASYVAFTGFSIFVLCLNGRLYTSKISVGPLSFSLVKNLADIKIISLSGTCNHCLAVADDGRVFGFGSNEHGMLGLGGNFNGASSFTEISSLRGIEIVAVYAGGFHSLFQTKEGKILACGSNNCGQLMLDGNIGQNVYSPTETVVTKGATFCIAGYNFSMVFTGSDPPQYTPNMKISQYN